MDLTTRKQAAAACRRSRALRERTDRLCEELVTNLRRAPRSPFGDRGDTFALRLARISQAVSLLRDDLGRWLEQRGVAPEDATAILLASSEACANAVEHVVDPSRQLFSVEATHAGESIEVVVHDFGRWDPSGS